MLQLASMPKGLHPASFTPGPSPRQGKLFFLASQCSRNPRLFPVKTSMAGPTPVFGVQSECKAVYTGAPPTTSPDSAVSPTHTCPVPTSQGHPHPRLWGCKAEGGKGEKFQPEELAVSPL